MKKLTPDQRGRIKEILDRIFENRKEEEVRTALLENCDVKELTREITMGKPHDDFILSLLAKLQQNTGDDSEESALTVFLRGYNGLGVAPKLTDVDLEFIQSLNKNNTEPDRKEENKGAPVGRDLIFNFDILNVESKFLETLNAGEGVFGFSFGDGTQPLLEDWFLYRLKHVYEKKQDNTLEEYEIFLKSEHAGQENIIRDLIEQETGRKISRWPEIFQHPDNSKDVLILVWNSQIVSGEFSPMVESFWKSLLPLLSKFKGTSRFLFFIWLNEKREPIDIKQPGFFVPFVGKELEESTVRSAMKILARKIGQEFSSMETYLEIMKNENFHINRVYGMLNRIVNTSQGALTQHV